MNKLKIAGIIISIVAASVFVFLYFGRPHTVINAILNEAVKQAMYDIADETEVCKCSSNSDYNFTDTATKKSRYQAAFDLVHF